MKNRLRTLLFAILSGTTLYADMPSAMPTIPNPAKGQSFDEFFFDTIANMTPDELDELAKIGEQIAEDMEKQGIDVDKFIEDQLKELSQPSQPVPAKEKAEEVKETKAVPKPITEPKTSEKEELVKTPVVDEEKQKVIYTALGVIIEKIPEIMRQVFEDRKLKREFEPLVHDVQDLGYYAYVMRQQKLLKFIATPEFARLYENITLLGSLVEEQESLLFTPEPGLEDPYTVLGVSKTADQAHIENAYRRLLRKHNPERVLLDLDEEGVTAAERELALKEADAAFKEIEDAYYDTQRIEKSRSAFAAIKDGFERYVQPIIQDARKLLQSYEPEALALKEEQERREKEAKALAKEAGQKEAPYAPAVFEFNFPTGFLGEKDSYGSASSGGYPYPYGGGYGGGSYGDGQGGKSSGFVAPGGGGHPSSGSAGGGTAGKEVDKNTKKDEGKPAGKGADKTKDKAEQDEQKKKQKAQDEAAEFALKLTLRKEEFDRIGAYLNEAYSSTTPTVKRLSLFKDFSSKYLAADDIAKPYTSSATLLTAAQINKTLEELTKRLKTLNSDITRDAAKLSGDKKAAFKEKMKEAMDTITKDYFEKDMKELVGMKVALASRDITFLNAQKPLVLHIPDSADANPIKKEKLYLHFGINAFDNIKDVDNAPILNLNPLDANRQGTNFVGDFIASYNKLKDFLKK